jgi:hypothetical protein
MRGRTNSANEITRAKASNDKITLDSGRYKAGDSNHDAQSRVISIKKCKRDIGGEAGQNIAVDGDETVDKRET